MEYKDIVALSEGELLKTFETSREGLSNDEVKLRQEKYGLNSVKDHDKHSVWYFLLGSFRDEFIIVLLLLAVVSFILQDSLGAMIIIVLALISAGIRFVQDYSAYRASEALKTMVHTHVDVRRNHEMVEVNLEDLVIGDIVELASGSLVSADLFIIDNKDLFISQSIFTGESLAVEKKAGVVDSSLAVTDLQSICLMGSSVVTGSGVGVVVKTGKETYLGEMSLVIEKDKEQTNFELGLKGVTDTLVKYMVGIVALVFLINGIVKGDWLMAFMFSISVAVGITPGMLPMIVNGALARGAQSLAKKKMIVKHLGAIQNLGSVDVLCTDKTGTLTQDKIVLQRYLNIHGDDDKSIFEYAYLNSFYSTGIKNLIDHAILDYAKVHGTEFKFDSYTKVDELPFDYNRKRMSVVLKSSDESFRMITKGALEEVIGICTSALDGDKEIPMNDDIIKGIQEHADLLNRNGMHVIVIAEKIMQGHEEHFTETAMCFVGYLAFLDPPKAHVDEAIKRLYESGVSIKVLTGDAALVAKNVCMTVGIESDVILTGKDLDSMDDATLMDTMNHVNIFARLAPMQKDRVVRLLREKGHVVGYLGDGVNDAPSLRNADVGISVDSATDIAKESSDIIMLEKELSVLVDGVYEGRRIYGNITKYMKMSLSSNVGNVVSVLISSLFLPFLPMIPIQILIQNLIYDMSQIAIPWDNVDESFIAKPKRWDMRDLIRFMNVMGIMSSIFDVVTFSVLWFVLSFNSIEMAHYFQTGWFIQGLISQTIIVHFIRTQKIPFFESIANIRLLLSTGFAIVLALLVPYVLQGFTDFNFVLLPLNYYFFLVLILFGYAISIEMVKRVYIKKYGTWL